MTMAQSLLPEFDQEMALTRKTLERVPTDRGAWKPHAKSFPIGHLAQLLSRMPTWLAMIMQETEIDINPPAEKRQFAGYSLENTEKLLAEFDEAVAKARAAIASGTDASFAEPWQLKAAGHVVMATTRSGMIRNTISHIVHHRGQMTVYLRLLDIPVPSLYGPSADERM